MSKSADRPILIYNGIDLTAAPDIPEHKPDRPFLVSIGRFVPWKGFEGLVRMLARIPEWSLVLVGDGPDRVRIETLAREQGVASRVRFTGDVPRAQVLGWLASADAFVLNSSFESFSYQVVEALAAGVPTIVTRIGSIPELISDGEEGVLVSPGDFDAIERALDSVQREPDTWKLRTAAGRKKAMRFSAERTAQAFADLIKSLRAPDARI